MFTKDIKVGIGDVQFSRNKDRLITFALGSCIGITFYDPMTKAGALLHIMLPERIRESDANIYHNVFEQLVRI